MEQLEFQYKHLVEDKILYELDETKVGRFKNYIIHQLGVNLECVIELGGYCTYTVIGDVWYGAINGDSECLSELKNRGIKLYYEIEM